MNDELSWCFPRFSLVSFKRLSSIDKSTGYVVIPQDLLHTQRLRTPGRACKWSTSISLLVFFSFSSF